MTKIKQTSKELKNHLSEQLDFLESSCDAYDQKKYNEGKRIAVIIRTLLHNTKNSTSLIHQLGFDQQMFLSTCFKDHQINPKIKTSWRGLINMFIGDDSETFYISLDDAPDKNYLKFDDWWNEIVLIDQDQNKFSRKDIVLTIANKDGGAHIDPSIDQNYINLSRNNSLGNLMQKDGKWLPLKTPELATVRQIAHEVLKTFVDDYQKKPLNKKSGFIIGNFSIN